MAYSLGICKFCEQGELTFFTEEGTGTIYVVCDECLTTFDNPSDAKRFKNMIETKKTFSKPSAMEEIKGQNWDKYIKEEIV